MKKPKVGQAMAAAIRYVSHNPGCSIRDVVRALYPQTRVMQTGYGPVHRAIKAGYIEAGRGKRGRRWIEGSNMTSGVLGACSTSVVGTGARTARKSCQTG